MEEYKLSLTSIKNILTFRYDSTKETLLPKLTWKDFVEHDVTNPADFVEKSIISSIKKSVGNSKKISLALSAGVDSTLMLALLRKTFPDVTINAISFKFAESVDESTQAEKIAQLFDASHKVVFVENYLKELPRAISIIKAPFWDLHWYHVVKEAKSASNFLVSGDGGDELFGGYTFRYEKFLSLVNSKSSILEKIKAYLQCHERDWVPDQEKVFGEKTSFSWDEIYSILKPYFDNPLPALAQVFLADFNGKLLYNWLPLNTAFHQYFGIVPVTPILSSEMISYATHLPYDLKYNKQDNVGKILLRKILSKYLSENLIPPTKQGFSVDTINLWKSHGSKLCDYYLSNSRIVKEGWISQDWITSHYTKLESEPDIRYVNKFLGLLALEIWYRLFVTKEMKSADTLD